MNTKQTRYDKLYQLIEDGDSYTDEQVTECVQLFYELNSSSQYWRDTSPNLTPRDVWGVDTSCYDN